MEVLVRWDDGVQNIVPSSDLRKIRQTNKNWKRIRFIQKFKEGDRVKMWYIDKWFFGIILFVDSAHILSDNQSVLPLETSEILINKDDSVEEEFCCNYDDTDDSGNLNIVLSEPFTLDESFNCNEKECQESHENNSGKGDKTLSEIKKEKEDRNISSIRTRRKQYIPVKLPTRKAYNTNKYKTKIIPPVNIQANPKTKILHDLELKPCAVVLDDSIAKRLRVTDTYRISQSELVGLALDGAESVAEPMPNKRMEKNPSMMHKSTATRDSLRRNNKKLSELLQRRKASVAKQKLASLKKKTLVKSHFSKTSLTMDFFEQNTLNEKQIINLMENEKVEITQNKAEELQTSDGSENSGEVTTADQKTVISETEKDLPKKTNSKITEHVIQFVDKIPAKKKKQTLTTAEFFNQNLSLLRYGKQNKTQKQLSSKANENNLLRIPPSLEVIPKDSIGKGETSTTKTSSSHNNNESGKPQPIGVQVFIKDPKTKSVISQADLIDIRRKSNLNCVSSNSPKTKLEFTRSLVPFIPPIKLSESAISFVHTKQSNLDALKKNKLISSKCNNKKIPCMSLMDSNSSEKDIAKSMNSENSVNSSIDITLPHSPQSSDSEMTLNDLLKSSKVTDIRKSIDKSEESQDESSSDSVLTLEALLKSGDAVSLDHKYDELRNRLSSPALLLPCSRSKKIIHPPKPGRMNNPINRKTPTQLIENKKSSISSETLNNPNQVENASQITDPRNVLKEVAKPVEPDVEECLDGVPPFIRDVFECGNIRDGFIASDLVFVLSLLPDIEEMTDSQKIKFQVRVIEMLNDVMNDPHLTYC